ncbi:MAG TPA: sigma-70 family RNA polymerase sigma factor [Candidatus Binatia bacterium]|nr:sigma-70 family RNA polymerase sigma factor [Candidatus Binatia bacterium]
MSTPRSADDGERRLWQEWRDAGCRRARSALVERYAWLARAVAVQVLRQQPFPAGLELRELVQLATVGLIEAVDRFEPVRGVPFAQYADRRLRGAVRDGIARTSEVHGQCAMRRRLRRERAASLRGATAAADLDLVARLVEVAVGLAVGVMLEGTGLFDAGDAQASGPYRDTALAELRRQLHAGLDRLPAAEQHVLRCHYLQDLPMADVARQMDLSRGRISQIHARGIAALRAQCGAMKELLAEA